MPINATRVAYIDGKIQYGRGRAAQVLGQTYNIYRNTNSTNNAVMSGNVTYANFPIRFRRATQKVYTEDQVFDLLVFVGLCNDLNLQINDIAEETGYKALESNIFTFVQARPTRENIFIRTESSCTLSRPTPTAGQASQLPAQGAVAVPGWGGMFKAVEWVMTLNNGRYQYSNASEIGSTPGLTPASIQCGIQQMTHIRDANNPKFPITAYRERFLLFIPTTPGEEVVEHDIVNAGNGDRYLIASILQTSEAGVSGWVCIGERLA